MDGGIGSGGIGGFIIHPCVSEISLENSLPATEARSTSTKLRAVILPPGLKEEKRKASCSAVGLAFDKLVFTKLGNALLKSCGETALIWE